MRWIGAGILGLLTLAHWFGPFLMRRGLFFGTTVPTDFRDAPAGRSIVRRYQIQTFVWGLAAIMLALLAPDFGHSLWRSLLPWRCSWLAPPWRLRGRTVPAGFTLYLQAASARWNCFGGHNRLPSPA